MQGVKKCPDLFGPDDEKAARYESLIDNIKGEVARISRFAESFLEYGRPFELQLRRCSLNLLLDQVLELVDARAAAGHVEIRRDIAPLPELTVDPEFTSQAEPGLELIGRAGWSQELLERICLGR